MLPKNRVSTHPGIILWEDFLRPLGITQVAFAAHIGVPVQRLNEIIRAKRGISPDTAWRIAQALGTTPEYWMSLQAAYDLTRSRPAHQIMQLRTIGG